MRLPGGVEIILSLPYLIDRPFLRQRGEGIGNRPGVVIIQRRVLAPQRDIDRQRNLLDRREAIKPMRTHVALQIQQFVAAKIGFGVCYLEKGLG